jgi:hypothetical protein
MAFAGDSIPGVGVGAGRNPGGIMVNTKTGSDGKFTLLAQEKGKYDLKISYAEIVRIVSGLIKSGSTINDYTFTLTLDSNSPGLLVNGKVVHEITITNAWVASNPQFTVTKAGTTISGKFTYQRKAAVPAAN